MPPLLLLPPVGDLKFSLMFTMLQNLSIPKMHLENRGGRGGLLELLEDTQVYPSGKCFHLKCIKEV